MNLCSGKYMNTHDEICFEGRDCPLCAANAEIEILQREVDNLNNEQQTGG